MGAEEKVIVVGGGIVGIACAHYLSEAGFAVTVIDKGKDWRGLFAGQLWVRLSESHSSLDRTGSNWCGFEVAF